jgi:saccharopine dehydrogenase-like NADP-dependent oxidoreductase
MKGVDVAICLLPRDFALPMAELAVDMGVNYACASYMGSFCSDEESRARQAQRLSKLEEKAKLRGVLVLTQFGLDPGLDLLLAGEAVKHFDKVDDFISYGAGFPDLRASGNPLRYKFTWTVEGVMRSYYRPARIIRDSRVVDIAPNQIFSPENTHMLSVEELGGKLECFPNGDAVVLADELNIAKDVRSMGRYVCRWEGHCAFWNIAANCGFLRDEPVMVKGVPVNKISFFASALASEPQFTYVENEQDVTFTRVSVTGTQKGRRVREVYQIIDKKDLKTGFTSMTRTVGFVVSLGAIMILDGELGESGVISPVGMPFEKTVEKLRERNIYVTHMRDDTV